MPNEPLPEGFDDVDGCGEPNSSMETRRPREIKSLQGKICHI